MFGSAVKSINRLSCRDVGEKETVVATGSHGGQDGVKSENHTCITYRAEWERKLCYERTPDVSCDNLCRVRGFPFEKSAELALTHFVPFLYPLLVVAPIRSSRPLLSSFCRGLFNSSDLVSTKFALIGCLIVETTAVRSRKEARVGRRRSSRRE